MSQSEVFKACLALFKQESSLVGDKNLNLPWNEADVTSMGFLFDNLSNIYQISSFDDQLKVLPHIISMAHRSIQRCISPDLKIINIKALLACVCCLSNALSTILVESNPKHSEAISTVTTQDVLLKIVLLDVALFEILKNSLQLKDALAADEERMSLLCLSLLFSILGAYSSPLYVDSENKLAKQLNGHLLAQTIQSILVFAQSKDKLVSQKSLQCLLQLCKLLRDDHHQGEWRNYFPGLFSGLYGLCCSGYKR